MNPNTQLLSSIFSLDKNQTDQQRRTELIYMSRYMAMVNARLQIASAESR